MRRLLTALVVLVLSWLTPAAIAVAVGDPATRAATYTYDSHHLPAVLTDTTTERGPPMTSHDREITHDVVGRRPDGAWARLDETTPRATTTHNAPVGFAQVTLATGATQERAQGTGGEWSFEWAGVAAEAGSAAGKEFTTYYSPDRGFLGTSAKEMLDSGTRIDRYGGEGGYLASPAGTSMELRALSPVARGGSLNTDEAR